jgi:hypothetical protein
MKDVSNNMKLIMENWRKFTNNADNLSNILIETKNYNSYLDVLVDEHKNKKISTKKYISILQESINKDFTDLEILNEQLLQEALGDNVKKLGQKVVGAAKGVLDTVIKKINDMIMKVSLMIWKAPRQAALNAVKFLSFLKKFKETNPKTYAFLAVSVKILAFIAIAYAFLHPGTAEASVPIDQYGAAAADHGVTKMVDASSEEGKQLLGALRVLAPENLSGTPLEGIEEGQLKAASEILQKAVMSKKPEQIQGALKTILNAADTLSKQASNSGESETLQNLGKKVLQLAGEAVEKTNDVAITKVGAAVDTASGLNITGQTSLQKLSSLTKPGNVEKLISMFGGENVSSMDSANIMRKALKYALDNKQISPEEYTSLLRGPSLDAASERLRSSLQAMGK